MDAAGEVPGPTASTALPRSLAWAGAGSACAVPLALISFLPYTWHRTWATAWILACSTFLRICWVESRRTEPGEAQDRVSRVATVLRLASAESRRRAVSAFAVAAVLALVAGGTAWATAKTYCPRTVNACYSQEFRTPGVHLSPLLWPHGLRPAAITRALLAVVACSAVAVAWWRPRAAAYFALPLMLVAFTLATVDGPQMSPRWSRTDVLSWRVPAVGMWLAIGSLIATAIATVTGLAIRQTAHGELAQDKPSPAPA
jgi:hypothetical protein